MCDLNLYFTQGDNALIDDASASATLETIIPSQTSVKNVQHFAQIHDNRRFQDFDYGSQGNMNRYGSETPPEFDLTQITDVPIAILIEPLDDEGTALDNEWLIQQLNDIVVFNRTYEDYAHFDFYVAKDTTVYLNDVINLLQEYNQV